MGKTRIIGGDRRRFNFTQIYLSHLKKQSASFMLALRPNQDRGRRMTIRVVCIQCRKIIPKKKGLCISSYLKQKYCSRLCHDHARRKWLSVYCFTCGKLMLKRPSDVKHPHIFCSRKCLGKWPSRQEDGKFKSYSTES